MSVSTTERREYLRELRRCVVRGVTDREELDRLHAMRAAAGVDGEEHSALARQIWRAHRGTKAGHPKAEEDGVA